MSCWIWVEIRLVYEFGMECWFEEDKIHLVEYSCEEDGDLCVFPVCDEGHDGGGTGRTNTQRRRR